MKIFSLLLILFISSVSLKISAQAKTTIYLIPGQGSDKRIFDSLTFDSAYNVKYLEYGTPEKGTTMSQFAALLAKQIDTNQGIILIGVSLGGMLCSEINEIVHTEKVIVISSAKNRNELPFRYKFQRVIPIYKLFPARVLFAGAKLMQPIVEPDRNTNKETFKSMLYSKKPTYIKRTIEMIIKWDRKTNSKTITHIHGTKDHTIPIRNISPNFVVVGGSHMMTLTRAKEINELLNIELTRK